MKTRIKQYTAIIAVAMTIAYLGTATVPPMRSFAPLPATLWMVILFSAICGVLLAFVTPQAPKSMAIASLLAMLIFAGIRAYVVGWRLSQFISFTFFELIFSDSVFLYTMHRGLFLFLSSGLVGLMGAVVGIMVIPERLRP